jgi:diguanylate cyclase (GGDEF)-like protein
MVHAPGGMGSARVDNLDLAFTDPLTGLGNRRRFLDKVERLIDERAEDPAPFAIGIIDLDGFKPINDLFGRGAGDHILIQAAMRLRAAMDEQSTVTRFGADEFAVLFPMTFGETVLVQRLRMLTEILSAPYDVGNRSARLSASAGCALYYSGDDTAEKLIQKSETALYHAKRAGRSGVFVYTQAMEEAARHVTQIEQALRRALHTKEVRPYFQPIVDLRTRRVIGFEALARWNDPDLGAQSPAVFIPIAEERGIIGPLSQLLLRRATAAACAWPDELFLSFNLSQSQLVDQNTALTILTTLDQNGFDPRRLEIEITETGLMSDPVSAKRIISELQRAGIRVALDDFGTGQSSLGRLREFRFDKLKIDRSFVAPITEDKPSEHIVKAILSLCDGLGMTAVAEGIETEAQVRRLVQLGCTGGQGFLFGRPADTDRTLALIREDALQPTPAIRVVSNGGSGAS